MERTAMSHPGTDPGRGLAALALAVEEHFGLSKTPRVDVVKDHHLAAASGLLMETIYRWLHTPDQLKASPTGTLS